MYLKKRNSKGFPLSRSGCVLLTTTNTPYVVTVDGLRRIGALQAPFISPPVTNPGQTRGCKARDKRFHLWVVRGSSAAQRPVALDEIAFARRAPFLLASLQVLSSADKLGEGRKMSAS